MKRTVVFLLVLWIFAGPLHACRFTIREIGYTPLQLQTYVMELEVDTVKRKDLFNNFVRVAKDKAGTTNIRYRIYQRPGLKNGILSLKNTQGLTIASEKISLPGETGFFYEKMLFSPLQRTLEQQTGNVFAFVVCFYETDNRVTDRKVEDALEQFRKLAPTLDKSVSEEIMKIIVPASRRTEEEVVMRAAGIDPAEKEPVVMILYGRGRLVAAPLTGKEITVDHLLNQLVMLGTDCECGIDLSPLLKRAIPLQWTKEMGQRVADMLGFDVGNPMILTEMGKILSKEPTTTVDEALTFAPRTVDLDKALGRTKRKVATTIPPASPSKTLKNTLLYAGGFLLILLLTGLGIFFLRKRRA